VVSRGGFCRLENDQEEGATHDLERIRPFEDSPCLHRIVADCPPEPDCDPLPGEPFWVADYGPEPLDLWRQEILALRGLTVPKLAGKLAAARFQLIPVEGNGAVVLRYRAAASSTPSSSASPKSSPVSSIAPAVPHPTAVRWFLKSAGRGDRRFCSLFPPLQDESLARRVSISG
jgi:hypothetical protein